MNFGQTEYQAELAEQMTLENVVSDCSICNGSGIIMVADAWGEKAEECECLKNYTSNF